MYPNSPFNCDGPIDIVVCDGVSSLSADFLASNTTWPLFAPCRPISACGIAQEECVEITNVQTVVPPNYVMTIIPPDGTDCLQCS